MGILRCDLCDDEDAVFTCADCSYNFCSLVSVVSAGRVVLRAHALRTLLLKMVRPRQCSTAVHEDAGRQLHVPRRLDDDASTSIARDVHAPPLTIPTPAPLGLTGSPGSGPLPTTPGSEGGRVWVSLPDALPPASPCLAHRVSAPEESTGTQCVQCASVDSIVGGVCQLCGSGGEASTRQNEDEGCIPRCPTAGHVSSTSQQSIVHASLSRNK